MRFPRRLNRTGSPTLRYFENKLNLRWCKETGYGKRDFYVAQIEQGPPHLANVTFQYFPMTSFDLEHFRGSGRGDGRGGGRSGCGSGAAAAAEAVSPPRMEAA